MNYRYISVSLIGALSLVTLSCKPSAKSQPNTAGAAAQTTTIVIPESIRIEHGAIHAALVEATQAPGRVGGAAKELARILHPHFVREEQIALPPLGLLAALAANTPVPDSVLSEAMAMSDALKAELPRMLQEHKEIRAAVANLLAVARAEQATKAISVAEQLAVHAQSEEEVFYPATLLVGDIIRARARSK